jgi:hypothetical protein
MTFAIIKWSPYMSVVHGYPGCSFAALIFFTLHLLHLAVIDLIKAFGFDNLGFWKFMYCKTWFFLLGVLCCLVAADSYHLFNHVIDDIIYKTILMYEIDFFFPLCLWFLLFSICKILTGFNLMLLGPSTYWIAIQPSWLCCSNITFLFYL